MVETAKTPKGQRARAKILATTEALFAVHGFHGTSMRDIATAARLPLATVVYHFARKAQLYAAVLATIGDELMKDLDEVERATLRDRPGQFARVIVRWTACYPGRVRLVLRELLDNPSRVAHARQLPLAPFLERAAALLGRRPDPELAVLHVIGGISYVVAAWPTVHRMVGPDRARRLAAGYEREAIAFAHRVLRVEDPS